MEIANTKPSPVMVLRPDTLNMDVLRLLMTRYTVIVEQKEKQIIIELHRTQQWKQQT